MKIFKNSSRFISVFYLHTQPINSTIQIFIERHSLETLCNLLRKGTLQVPKLKGKNKMFRKRKQRDEFFVIEFMKSCLSSDK